MRQACEAGALRFLEAHVLRSVPFEDEPPEQQELYAHAAHQLLMLFLDAQPGRCDRWARLRPWRMPNRLAQNLFTLQPCVAM